jgi:hypothetical protein
VKETINKRISTSLCGEVYYQGGGIWGNNYYLRFYISLLGLTYNLKLMVNIGELRGQ